jgi:hypothetical protein
MENIVNGLAYIAHQREDGRGHFNEFVQSAGISLSRDFDLRPRMPALLA